MTSDRIGRGNQLCMRNCEIEFLLRLFKSWKNLGKNYSCFFRSDYKISLVWKFQNCVHRKRIKAALKTRLLAVTALCGFSDPKEKVDVLQPRAHPATPLCLSVCEHHRSLSRSFCSRRKETFRLWHVLSSLPPSPRSLCLPFGIERGHGEEGEGEVTVLVLTPLLRNNRPRQKK